MKKISINITNQDYEIIKKSPYSQREILEKGIQLITNTETDQILKKQDLTKKINKTKYKINKQEFELKQLKTQLTEMTKELDKINQEKIEHIITHKPAETIKEYTNNKSYQRGLDNLKHAMQLTRLPLNDFINMKDDYISRVCETNHLDKDKLISLFKQQKKNK